MMRRLLGIAIAALAGLSADAGERHWYASIEGGATQSDVSKVLISSFSVFQVLTPDGQVLAPLANPSAGGPPLARMPGSSTDTGAALLGAIGVSVTDNIRIEAEFGWRSNDYGEADFVEATQITQRTAMLNALYDIPLSDDFSISLGAGAGMNWTRAESNYFTLSVAQSLSTNDSGFAWQGIAGINYRLTDNLDLSLTYRNAHVSGLSDLREIVSNSTGLQGLVIGLQDLDSHTVSLGLRLDF